MRRKKLIKGRAPETLRQETYEEGVAAAMGASPETANGITQRADIERFILTHWEHAAARLGKRKAELIADIEKDPINGLRWAGGAAASIYEADIYRQALEWQRASGKSAGEIAAALYDQLSHELISDNFRPTSSSPFSNATEIAKAEATSRVCRDLKSALDWLKREGK